ncbi:MAG: phosphate acyltransferase [Candidatus Omnitrophica bacterium]|nr:phosphate acyltransferase [Candidatus Omnitrophota bacterium]MDD5430055.1 phosphate acyltransferase [Candidatus Omnitrophota bacterium]
MEKVIQDLRDKARKDPKVIVFPEANDDRVFEAVKRIKDEGIAKPLLLTQDNLEPERQEEFANLFFERKQAKGVTFEEARELMENPLYYGAMLTRYGYADGFVAGAKFTTSSVIRTALSCLEVDKKAGIVSSCFIMAIPNCSYGERGVFIYADCGVIPYPTSDQLANIAVSSAYFAKTVLDIVPRVALLSFSTKGSAAGRWVDKIKEAVEIANGKNSGFMIDGELQGDSALDPEVASRKLDQSDVAGKANVLIFPNLDAGNICYKLTQRLAKGRAVGPIVLGTIQPCSDLSRGCEVEDIVDCAAVTVIRAQNRELLRQKEQD